MAPIVRRLVLLTLLSSGCTAAAQDSKEWAELVLQNELLRDHFREELWRETGQGDHHYSSTPAYSTAGIPSNLGSIERSNAVRIDEQVNLKIVQLLDRVNGEFAELRSSSRALAALSLACRQSENSFSGDDRRSLKNQLEKLRNSSRSLHKLLKGIYSSLPGQKIEEKPAADEKGDACLTRTIQILSDRIVRVEQSTREILAGGYVVILDELNRSFLSELDEIQFMADRLKKGF